NGGWTTLDVKDGPKSDTYKCQCPWLYAGDLCEFGPRRASKYNGNNTSQYGKYINSSTQFNAFSISVWITIYDDVYYETRHPAVVSHAFQGKEKVHANAPVILFIKKNISIYFFDSFRSGHIGDIFDGKQYHIMITWQKVDGQMIVYKDGEQKYSTIVAENRTLLAGGVWVIGQDQDSLDGGFQNRNSFKGTIDAVYIWDKVLSIDDIKQLAKSCNAYLSGYIIGYHDFKFTNTTNLIEPTCYT
ncbi:neuronal pentraxin-2-like, partial [Xenia sp. Carnegie-2017]|uniref:neuronal pentraxin-2-like n=1 Tax=Xenia sp. Carnegie-2017 TaxID=2897299 RepID=UPI001F03343A